MRIGVLARNEVLKTSRRTAFWVSLLSFGGIISIIVGESFYRGLSKPESAFTLPGGWADVMNDIGPLPGFFGAVAAVLLITSEFSWKTARQNVIDGLSKEEFFVGKLMVFPPVIFIFMALAMAITGVLGFAGTRLAGAGGPYIQATDLALMGGVVLCGLGYASLAFFAAFLTRASGAAMGLFFLYVAFAEQIFGAILGRMGEMGKTLVPFMPRVVFDSLVQEAQFSPGARQALVERALEAGREAPTFQGTGLLVGVAGFWIVLLVGISFWIHEGRDL